VCQRHDVSYSVAVKYRAVDSIVAASTDSKDHGTTAWRSRVVGGDAASVQLNLSSRLNYQVLVKSWTSAGFNTSLSAQPIYISGTYGRAEGEI